MTNGAGSRRSTEPSTTSSSLARRITVTVGFMICVAGGMSGAGLFGAVPVSEAADGLLSPETTQLAPASPAFSVWSVIYIALGAYTLWQWWDRTDPRRLGWLLAASMVLNAAWIVTVQWGQLWLSVLVIAVLAGSGAESLARSTAWATGALVVIALIGVALAILGRGRLAVAATMTWGLAWIAVARATGEPASTVTVIAAGTAGALILLVTLVSRLRAGLRPPAGTALAGA